MFDKLAIWSLVFRYMGVKSRCVAVLFLLTVIICACGFIFPWSLQKIIDLVLSGSTEGLHVFITICLFSSLIEIVLVSARSKLSISVSADAEFRLTTTLTSRFINSSSQAKLDNASGTLNTLNGVQRFVCFLLQTMPQCLLDIGQALLAFTLIGFYSYELFIVICVILFLSTIVQYRLFHKLQEESSRHYSAESQKLAYFTFISSGLKSIKRQASEDFLSARVGLSVRCAIKLQSMLLDCSRVIQVFGLSTSRVLVVVILFYGAYLVGVGAITVGELMAIQVLLARLASPLLSISQTIPKYYEANELLVRIGKMLMLPGEPSKKTPIYNELFSIRAVSACAKKETGDRILENVSCFFEGQGFVAISGSNGAGKTTLLDVLIGQHELSRGEVLISGAKVSDHSREYKSRFFSFVEQEHVFFPGTIRDNLICGSDVSDERIWATLRSLKVDDAVLSLENKLDHLLSDKGRDFSGGQRQKLCLARALLKSSNVILCDEPTSMLDGNSRDTIIKVLVELSVSRLVLCVTHDVCVLERASSVIFMADGAIVASGSHSDLLESCSGYRKSISW